MLHWAEVLVKLVRRPVYILTSRCASLTFGRAGKHRSVVGRLRSTGGCGTFWKCSTPARSGHHLFTMDYLYCVKQIGVYLSVEPFKYYIGIQIIQINKNQIRNLDG